MILKKPTYDIESSQLLLETAAVATAILFPAARIPALVFASLSLLSKWAGRKPKPPDKRRSAVRHRFAGTNT